jgi:DNA-directed RNA polymerase subunit RPC12/RpoP
MIETLLTVEFAPEVRCPLCGHTCLYQGRVTVFDRNEDAKMTVVTTVVGGLSAADLLPSDQVANPSIRRHGLAIAFGCEVCGGDIELTIAQHKGNTQIAWRSAKGT